MHIVNIMFSRGYGGIEQAFLDYCEGLSARGHRVTAVCSPDAKIRPELEKLKVSIVEVSNFGVLDFFARLRLRAQLKTKLPDVVIGHGMRAYALGRAASRGICPMVGVTHNYSTRRFSDADGVFAITHDLQKKLLSEGVLAGRIFAIPNMVRVKDKPVRTPWGEPPVIGAMGRLVAKKGFDVYIDALALLAQRHTFRALIGGSGPEEEALRARAIAAGLEDKLAFVGWVQNKKEFFANLDIFCLPSLHEPFGIVLLEAFAHHVPVISSDSEGPSDIITAGADALIVEKSNAAALAAAIAQLLADPEQACIMAGAGFEKVKSDYAMEPVCLRIEAALKDIIAAYLKKKS